MDGLTLTPELIFLLGVAVFWIVLYVLAKVFHLEKHGLDVQPGYFMFKYKRLNNLMDRVAHKNSALWLILSNIGLAFSIGLMAFSVYFLTNNLLRFVFPAIGQATQVFPAIPVLVIRLYWLPYFAFAVAVIALTHELAHGISARLEDVPILSTGVFAFVLFFGAFVEQDDKEFEKAPILTRLRMLASGSATNLVTGLLVTLLLTGLFFPYSGGVLIQEVVPDGPAYQTGIRQWDVILAVNGNPINFPQNFSHYMSRVTPGTSVNVTVLHNNAKITMNITTTSDPNNRTRAIIGIVQSFLPYRQNTLGLDHYTSINLYLTLFWTYLLAISVAIFNMFPAFPFDGERVLYYPLASLVKKRKRELRWTISIMAWGIFALNVALSILLLGFRSI
jgi:membrane-associated protease RseP (regulator of RpoE activity)